MTDREVENHGWLFWYANGDRRVYYRGDRVLTLWPNGDIDCVSYWAHVT